MYKVESSSPLSSLKSILIVDDSEDILALHRLILEKEGYQVSTANGAAAAFRILAEQAPPDLILLDVEMREMTGPQFLLQLTKKSPDLTAKCRVVFHSGAEEVPVTKAFGFIRKARGLDFFRKSVRDLIEADWAVSGGAM